MTTRRNALLLLIVTLVASACIRSNTTVVVNEDGSGTIEEIVAIDPEAMAEIARSFDEAAAADLGTTEEICEEFGQDNGNLDDLPPDAEITPFAEDGLCGERAFFSFGPGEAENAFADFDNANGATLTQGADGGWLIEVPFNSEDLASDEELAGAPQEVIDQIFEGFEVTYEVTLPGRPVDGGNNADRVDGNTFFWDVDILNPPDRFFAQTEPGEPDGGGGGGGGGWLTWLLIGLAVLALGALAFFFIRNRNATKVQAAPTAGTGPLGSEGQPGGGVMQSGQADTAASASAAGGTREPTWDAARQAWVLNDPQRGLLVHDATTGEWRQA